MVEGVRDLFNKGEGEPPVLPLEVDCEEYAPSEPPDQLFPELFEGDLDPGFQRDDVLEAITVDAVTVEGESVFRDVDPFPLPETEEGLKELIGELSSPVEQVVLRFFIPLRSKTGPEVTEAVQRMILGIMKDYPITSIHHDPGTEFSSISLSRWLSEKGIRVQHSLPTDKRGNGLAERTVGWVKERVRTLLKGASMPVHWWPIAARWAVHKHNTQVLSQPTPPAFGQKVLHRVKRPSDGTKQLMERWVEVSYGAPHRTVPGGHILITPAGNLVASRGFKSETIDPKDLKDIGLPILQEEDSAVLPPSHLPDEGDLESAAPSRRLRIKSKVRFVDLDDQDLGEVERRARVFLLEDDFSDEAFRVIVQMLRDCERPSKDRRGDLQEKFVFGAFCHGGNRGVTSLAKRRPQVTRFLNHFLRRRLSAQQFDDPLEWSALMILKGTEVEEHKDVRNEWGSFNYLLCLELQITNPGGKENEVLPLGSQAARFDARNPHLVRRNPDWFIVGYTPLGTPKIQVEEKRDLCELGFRLNERDTSQFKIRVVSAKGDSDDASSITDSSLPDLEPVDAGPGQQDLPYDLGEPSSEVSLEQDMQIDSVTQLIGWDPSQGEGHNYPVQNLEETDLQQYLDDRGVGWTFRRLVNLGVEMASDLAFLFQEDLVEFGIPPQDARRIMIGIHPAGTVRPDNPNLSSLTSGEVRLIDRQHRQIPWVIQNRTLSLNSPGPPAYGLGVRDPRLGPEAFEEDWVVSEERRRNEERWIQYTDLPSMSASSSTALPPLGTESVDFPPAQVQTLDVTQGNDQVPPQGDLWFSDYEGYAEYAMAMQAMWDEEEGFSDIGEGSGVLSDTIARPPLDTESVDFPAQVPTPSEGYCSVPPVRSGPCAICSVPPVRSGFQDPLVVSAKMSRKMSWPLTLRRRGGEQRPRSSSEPAPIVRARRSSGA